MFLSYLKTAYRVFLRHRVFGAINVAGLTCGLTCALLILTFVVDELSYDNFHSKGDRIYRLRYKVRSFDLARVPPIFKEHIDSFFPEVASSARLFSRAVSVKIPESGYSQVIRFEESNVNFTDPDLFDVFDFELIEGDLRDALDRPFTIVLSQRLANKYFGTSSALGQTLWLEGDHAFEITAVVKDFPSNSHTHFDMLVPFDNMYDLEPGTLGSLIKADFERNWSVTHSPTYILLEPGGNPAAVNARFEDFVSEKMPQSHQKGQRFELQPLSDIHLNDDVLSQAEPPGSREFIYIFAIVGLLTLLIACINFVNLSTAKSLQRAKEIGMRKVLGSSKQHLILQFMGEAFLTTVFAAVLSIAMAILLLPELNALTDKAMDLTILVQPVIVGGFACLIIFTSVAAGIYPAIFVTRISPLSSLKGLASDRGAGLSFRRVLMVIQFSISIMLIASALIVFDQLDLLRNKPLGFQKDHIVTVPVQSDNFHNAFGGVDGSKRQKLNAFEAEIAKQSGIIQSTLSSVAPGFGVVSRSIIPEGFTFEDRLISPVLSVDYDFVETYQMELVAGRSFSKDFGSDHLEAFILNERAVQEYNFESPEEAIGKSLEVERKEGKVIGVVKDFNFLSLNQAMRSIVLHVSVPQFSVFSIRIAGEGVTQTLESLKATWEVFFPEETFDYAFLDESLAANYENQEQFGKLISYFAILAIVISCLGSYGLIMFIVSRRQKELGVRKVLGASIPQIVGVLSYRFLLLVGVSILVAVPLTLWAAEAWLDNFSYRIEVSPWSLIVASVVTMLLITISIGFQSVKAAFVNPARILRME
ncbi:MAG: ABC transporter permease [Bacteroidota bacterium]